MSASLRFLIAVLGCSATTLFALPLATAIDLTNIAMLYLLCVAAVAAWLGSGPGVLASFASVALFDWFFVPPRFTFAVEDVQYLITFAVMLVVALSIGQLAARMRERAEEAQRRETQNRALYEMAREVSGTLVTAQVAEIVQRFLAAEANVTARLHLPPLADAPPPVRAVFESGMTRLSATESRDGRQCLLLPLRSPMQTRGVLEIAPIDEDTAGLGASRLPFLEAVASITAIAVERIHYSEVAQDVTLGMETERLRAALLTAVSHDLRTPLTVLVGLADTLAVARPPLPAPLADTACALRDKALSLSRLVDNLLEMARLQVGRVQLRREWQPLDEVVGTSLRAMEAQLKDREVIVDLPDSLPLLELDTVLVERVLCNLLDNALKYAPAGAITIDARCEGDAVEIAVSDAGPGLPPGGEAAIFGLFERGAQPGATQGVGLGLSICRAIVEAHGGRIRAENRAGGGARFAFTLPRGVPPAVEEEGDERR